MAGNSGGELIASVCSRTDYDFPALLVVYAPLLPSLLVSAVASLHTRRQNVLQDWSLCHRTICILSLMQSTFVLSIMAKNVLILLRPLLTSRSIVGGTVWGHGINMTKTVIIDVSFWLRLSVFVQDVFICTSVSSSCSVICACKKWIVFHYN